MQWKRMTYTVQLNRCVEIVKLQYNSWWHPQLEPKNCTTIAGKSNFLYKHIHCSKSMCYTTWRCFKHQLLHNVLYTETFQYVHIFAGVTLKPSSLKMNCWLWSTAKYWQVIRKKNTVSTGSTKRYKVNNKGKNKLPDLHPIMIPGSNTATTFSLQLKTTAAQNLYNWECNTIFINLDKKWLWLFLL